MIKRLLLIAILALNACTGTPDKRPHPVIQYKRIIQQGIQAYQQDNYIQAIALFNKARVLCQSIDDQQGILIVKINLIESALAISRFDLAEQNLVSLKNTKFLDSNLDTRIILLTAHSLFLQQHYQHALTTLRPLLSQLPDTHNQLSPKQINLLLTQTKLAVFAHSSDAKDWFKQLSTAMTENSTADLAQKALFKRLAAHMAIQESDTEQAISLMQQAIDSYKLKANRRAIASCLEEIALFYLARKNIIMAKDSLTRALLIRKWLQDTHKTASLVQQLKLLNSSRPDN